MTRFRRTGVIFACLGICLIQSRRIVAGPPSNDEIVNRVKIVTVQVKVSGTLEDNTSKTIYGSGVLLRTDGYIATAAHVVWPEKSWAQLPTKQDRIIWVKVPTANGVLGLPQTARLDRYDKDVDVAIIKIDGWNYGGAKCAQLANVRGTYVTRLGFPAAQGDNARVAEDHGGNTEAADNDRDFRATIRSPEGFSGGPVINSSGYVVGLAVKRLDDLRFLERAETEFVHIEEALRLLPQRGASGGCSASGLPFLENSKVEKNAQAENGLSLETYPKDRKTWTQKYLVPSPGINAPIGGSTYGAVVSSITSPYIAVAENELLRRCSNSKFSAVDFVLLGSSGKNDVYQVEIGWNLTHQKANELAQYAKKI